MWVPGKVMDLLKEIRNCEDLLTIDALTEEIEEIISRPCKVMEDEEGRTWIRVEEERVGVRG